MKNIIIITSIIDIPKQPSDKSFKSIDYPKDTRSIYTREERFQQTQRTIENVKRNIPDVKILLVECSQLTDEERKFLETECQWTINLIDNADLRENIYSQSKSLGEGTMMIVALEFLLKNNIEFDNLFKITGRYWLNKNFVYTNFENDELIFNNDHNVSIKIRRNHGFHSLSNLRQVVTAFYKITKPSSSQLLQFLLDNIDQMKLGIQYEKLIGYFLHLFKKVNKITYKKCVGVSGYIAIDGHLLDK